MFVQIYGIFLVKPLKSLKEIYEIYEMYKIYEIWIKFPKNHFIYLIIYYPCFYSSPSDKEQRNGGIFSVKKKLIETFGSY